MPPLQSLSASMEDYLETILREIEQNQVARVKDVADNLQVHKSSASSAVKTLADRGLLSHEAYGLIRLTPEGEKTARSIANRHEALRDFFTKVLGIEESEADRSACIMEHALPHIVQEHLARFMVFLRDSDYLSRWDEEHAAFRCPCREDPGQ